MLKKDRYSGMLSSYYFFMINKRQKIDILIHEARRRLQVCDDLLHDERHAQRVANYAISIANKMGIKERKYIESLIIGAWWHDVSRTITKKPSFVLMPLIDDTLSAIMLGITMLKFGVFHRSAWLAFRLVLSKSMATGRIFSRIFLSKNMRTLLDILHDADTVDTLASERMRIIRTIIGSSSVYLYGYKMMIWWFTATTFLQVKTQVAKEYLMQVLKEFLEWVSQEHIIEWHVERYGKLWADKMMNKLLMLIKKLNRGMLAVS